MIKQVAKFLKGLLIAPLQLNDSLIAEKLRSKFYDTETKIMTGVMIKNPANYSGGDKSVLYHGVEVLNQNGHVSLGTQSHLGAYCLVNAVEGSVTIGNNVAIGPGCKILSYSNSYQSGELVTETRTTANIVIGNNVFIGANTVVLPGTEIGDNTIIGAQSLAKGTLQGNAIYAGTPCEKIGQDWY